MTSRSTLNPSSEQLSPIRILEDINSFCCGWVWPWTRNPPTEVRNANFHDTRAHSKERDTLPRARHPRGQSSRVHKTDIATSRLQLIASSSKLSWNYQIGSKPIDRSRFRRKYDGIWLVFELELEISKIKERENNVKKKVCKKNNFWKRSKLFFIVSIYKNFYSFVHIIYFKKSYIIKLYTIYNLNRFNSISRIWKILFLSFFS